MYIDILYVIVFCNAKEGDIYIYITAENYYIKYVNSPAAFEDGVKILIRDGDGNCSS